MKTTGSWMGCGWRWWSALPEGGAEGRGQEGRRFRLEQGRVIAVSDVVRVRVTAGRIWLTGVSGAGDLIMDAGDTVGASRDDRLVLEALPFAEVRLG